MFGVQQSSIALDALEGIVGRALLVEAEVVPVGLFVLELIDVSSDDNADIWKKRERLDNLLGEGSVRNGAYRDGRGVR
jgi:hypothetical protein